MLDVVVKLELSWVRTQANVINLVLTLPFDPRFNKILGEYATLNKELVVLF